MKRLATRLGLSIAMTLLLVGLLEVGLRIIDPYGISYFDHFKEYRTTALRDLGDDPLAWEHHAGVDLEAGVRVRTGSFGLRGVEPQGGKPRLLFIGDSVTFGLGVAEEETFVHRLGEELGASHEVLNGGVVGYNSVQEELWLRKFGDQLKPDMVALLFVDNDTRMTDVRKPDDDGERQQALSALADRVPAWKRGIYESRWNLYLVHWLRYWVVTSIRQDKTLRPDLARFVQASKDAEDWDRALTAIASMNDWCGERSIPFVVLDYNSRELKDPARSLAHRLRETCETLDIAYFDTDFRKQAGAEEYRNSAVDSHPNGRAHAVLAERIGAALRQHGWFD